MIGPGSPSAGAGEMPPTSPEASASSPTIKPSSAGVIFRNNNAPVVHRPQSMYSGDKTSPNPRPFSVIGTPSDSITLSIKQWTELNDKVRNFLILNHICFFIIIYHNFLTFHSK